MPSWLGKRLSEPFAIPPSSATPLPGNGKESGLASLVVRTGLVGSHLLPRRGLAVGPLGGEVKRNQLEPAKRLPLLVPSGSGGWWVRETGTAGR